MKIEGNTLDPKTYTALLAQDFNDCQSDNPLCFVSKEFDKYIGKVMHLYNFNELNLIQKVIERQSVSFDDPNKTYKALAEHAFNRANKSIIQKPII